MPPVRYHYSRFPPNNLDWERLGPYIGPASQALGEFKGLLDVIPNPHILLGSLTEQEAVLTSRIEGTQATLSEVMQFKADENRPIPKERRDDIQEIVNYRHAVILATRSMNEIPLCGRLLKDAHKILMKGVRGRTKDPGNYKKNQNLIGPPGSTEETATFVPISPDKLAEGMTKWEQYLHSDQPDPLIQLGIVHAEFEALHPFLDGNGRIGRMLIPLFLYDRNIINSPDFYISEYLESHREEYYECLLAVSRKDDWTGWCVFFLKALATQAAENTRRARAIMKLYEQRKEWIDGKARSRFGISAIDFIFSEPVFKASDFGMSQGITYNTARRILRLIRDELLVEVVPASGRRSAVYAYAELLDIVEGT